MAHSAHSSGCCTCLILAGIVHAAQARRYVVACAHALTVVVLHRKQLSTSRAAHVKSVKCKVPTQVVPILSASKGSYNCSSKRRLPVAFLQQGLGPTIQTWCPTIEIR